MLVEFEGETFPRVVINVIDVTTKPKYEMKSSSEKHLCTELCVLWASHTNVQRVSFEPVA